MKRDEFISSLKLRLCSFNDRGIRDHLTFYSEMIDDKIEQSSI